MLAFPTCLYPPMFTYTSTEVCFFYSVSMHRTSFITMWSVSWSWQACKKKKKNEGCVATTVACFSSSINPSLSQWGRVLTLQSSKSVWELERDTPSAGGPTEWRVGKEETCNENRSLGREGWMKTEQVDRRKTDEWRNSFHTGEECEC